MINPLTRTVFKGTLFKLLREKWQLAMWLVIPMMMAALFSLMSGSDGNAKPSGILLITDNDESFLSQMFIRTFSQGSLADMFILEKVKKEQGQTIMAAGDASVWLTIEKDFTQNFIDNKPTTLRLVKNPSQNILPKIAETMVTTLADSGHYIQLLFSKELKQFDNLITGKDISDTQMAVMSVQIKHTVDLLEEQLFPPQIQAKVHKKKESDEAESKPKHSFMLLMFPGILFMSLLFSAQGMAQDFWKDKSQGILSRLLSSPAGLKYYFTGKLLSATMIFTVIAVLMASLGVWMFNINSQKLLIIIPWVVLSGVAIWSFLLFITLKLPTKKSANLVTEGMVFPLMMLGGSFFPFDSMPKWMVVIGEKLPNGYLLQSFNSWFIKEHDLSVLLTPALIALAFILVFFFINQKTTQQFARNK